MDDPAAVGGQSSEGLDLPQPYLLSHRGRVATSVTIGLIISLTRKMYSANQLNA